MIPILYESNETKFTSEGIGHLADAISCSVIENRNGSYELEMEYPVGGELFDEIKTDRIILAKPNDLSDPQPFDIYKISRTMDGTVTINAEHCSYRLSGIPVKPFSVSGINLALEGIKENSAIDNPFTFWTDIDNASSKFTVDVPKSARACLGGTDGSILDTFSGSRGCEFEFDRFNVKVHAHRGSDNGVVISYGKNLTDLTQEKSIASVYTGVLAYWKSNDQDDDTQATGEVQYVENHESYPRDLIYVLDASSDFEEAPSVSDLNSYAAKYISNNDIGTPSVSLTVSFIALWQTEEYKNIAPLERVSLCDYVTIRFEKLGVDATAEVIKTDYDVLTERYNEIELGDAQSSFSSTLKKTMSDTYATKTQVSETQSFLQSAIEHASELLKGAYGGHIVIGTNADGQPNEIYAMDTDDVSTAKKVLRINMNGIGGSTTGINGTYNVAMLTEGTINADAITVGTLQAGLIKAGVLSDATGKNYWNMETGELSLNAYATTEQMNSAINVSAEGIYTKVSNTFIGQNLWINTFSKESAYTLTGTGTDIIATKLTNGYVYTPEPLKAGNIISIQGMSDCAWASGHNTGGSVNVGKVGFWLYLGTLDQVKSGNYTQAVFIPGDNASTSLKHTSYTIPTVSGLTDIYIGFRFNLYSDGSTSKTAKVWNLQLELGSYATGWSIGSITTESQIKQNADSISLKVSKGNVRSQFAMESDEITISSGKITFEAGKAIFKFGTSKTLTMTSSSDGDGVLFDGDGTFQINSFGGAYLAQLVSNTEVSSVINQQTSSSNHQIQIFTNWKKLNKNTIVLTSKSSEDIIRFRNLDLSTTSEKDDGVANWFSMENTSTFSRIELLNRKGLKDKTDMLLETTSVQTGFHVKVFDYETTDITRVNLDAWSTCDDSKDVRGFKVEIDGTYHLQMYASANDAANTEIYMSGNIVLQSDGGEVKLKHGSYVALHIPDAYPRVMNVIKGDNEAYIVGSERQCYISESGDALYAVIYSGSGVQYNRYKIGG